MNLWYLLIFPAIIGFSWWVSRQYSDRCKINGTRYRWHGAFEFNATFFGSFFLILWFISDKPGNWVFAVIGGFLLAVVARRFWVNWDG